MTKTVPSSLITCVIKNQKNVLAVYELTVSRTRVSTDLHYIEIGADILKRVLGTHVHWG